MGECYDHGQDYGGFKDDVFGGRRSADVRHAAAEPEAAAPSGNCGMKHKRLYTGCPYCSLDEALDKLLAASPASPAEDLEAALEWVDRNGYMGNQPEMREHLEAAIRAHRCAPALSDDLARAIAYEAHMLGRIYNKAGEPEKPAEVCDRLDEMIAAERRRAIAGASQEEGE